MTILSLDASSKNTGYAIFSDKGLMAYGLIHTDGEDWREKLGKQAPKLKELIETYHPDKIIMEDVPLKSGGGMKILVILGAVQGFVLGIANAYNIPIEFISPTSWRSKLGLYDGTKEGKTRTVLKQRAVEYVNKEFGLNLKWVSATSKFNQDDVAEAVLIGYSTLKERKFGKYKPIS